MAEQLPSKRALYHSERMYTDAEVEAAMTPRRGMSWRDRVIVGILSAFVVCLFVGVILTFTGQAPQTPGPTQERSQTRPQPDEFVAMYRAVFARCRADWRSFGLPSGTEAERGYVNLCVETAFEEHEKHAKDRFGASMPPVWRSPSDAAKIEQDIASWSPPSSLPLNRGAPVVLSRSTLVSLKKWAGRYPILFSEDTPQKWRPLSKNFFELSYIQQSLTNLLDDDDFKKIAKEDWLINPIELIADHLVINRCRPHACSSEHVLLAVNLSDGSMHVGFWNRDEPNSRKIRWFSTKGDYKDLPKEILGPWYDKIRRELTY